MIIYVLVNGPVQDIEKGVISAGSMKHFRTENIGLFKCPSLVKNSTLKYNTGITEKIEDMVCDIPDGLLHEYVPYDVLYINYSIQPGESWSDFAISEKDSFWLTNDDGTILLSGTGRNKLHQLYYKLQSVTVS